MIALQNAAEHLEDLAMPLDEKVFTWHNIAIAVLGPVAG
jgi:hypothetical protein